MKMLYVVEDRFPPYRVDVVELFAKQMAERGHAIEWFMPRGNHTGNVSRVYWHNQTVYFLPFVKGYNLAAKIQNLVLSTAAYFRILILAARTHYDVIQVRDLSWASLLGLLAARINGAKFCYWMSFPFPEAKIYKSKAGLTRYRKMTFIKGWLMWVALYKIVFRLADIVFVQSDRMKTDVAQKGIPHKRLVPVLMGVKSGIVRTKNVAKKLNTEKPILLYLGTLERSRQPEILVDVLCIVKRHYSKSTLMYVGGGVDEGDETVILKHAKTKGVNDSVTITGMLPMETAWQLVEEADICFSPFFPIPTLLSTSPTKLIEYMAMAKNVVANHHPEMTEVMHESGVGQTVSWSAVDFANEVLRLLGNPAAAMEAAARGPDYVRKHRTYDVIAAKVDLAYRQLLAGG
jgi:glycosyltransferase involved in cell wall biosynthesis